MGPKLINVPSGFDRELHVFHIWDALPWTFPRFGREHCVAVSGRNYLNLFLPIIEWNSSENPNKIQIFEWLGHKLSVSPRNCCITSVNTHACNLHDGTSCFVRTLLEILLLAINLFVCYSDLLHSADTRSVILRAYCHGNWSNEPKSAKVPFLWYTMIRVISDHKSWSGSSQGNATLVLPIIGHLVS